MMGSKVSVCAAVFVLWLQLQLCFTFHIPKELGGGSYWSRSIGVGATPQSSSESPPEIRLHAEAIRCKDDLIALAERTCRGFSASISDRDEAKRIISNLSMYNPSDEPASAYFRVNETPGIDRSTIAGKWTLIYTDAPDITSLDGGALAMAKLGRIGQECSPPSIKNVIEWLRPDWASYLPFSGGETSRVLQKVCCEGSATQDNPKVVDLRVVGVELLGLNGGDDFVGGENIRKNNFLDGPATLLEKNPVKLQGPLTAPFGKFEILYLDNDMRVTKTFQGYLAVNIRDENPWF
ncbi:hypothetical protein ACHAXA_008359 [Cyclostephanos tholiformis]|uniref:Plastid lipid-associated protein/fibrillin conserved domain-containing protein n=1 Tax=Cyclostephanos tholiformis TaxID=382380 RepID=A0ABD3RVZ4_9STRA